jgi:hypothetical protein
VRLRRDGAGYTSRAWVTSPLLARIKALPPDQEIYSNAMIPLAFHTGRWYRGIPQPVDRVTALRDPSYEANLTAMADDLRSGHALFAEFDLPGAEPDPAVRSMLRDLDLQTIYRGPDGVLYAR